MAVAALLAAVDGFGDHLRDLHVIRLLDHLGNANGHFAFLLDRLQLVSRLLCTELRLLFRSLYAVVDVFLFDVKDDLFFAEVSRAKAFLHPRDLARARLFDTHFATVRADFALADAFANFCYGHIHCIGAFHGNLNAMAFLLRDGLCLDLVFKIADLFDELPLHRNPFEFGVRFFAFYFLLDDTRLQACLGDDAGNHDGLRDETRFTTLAATLLAAAFMRVGSRSMNENETHCDGQAGNPFHGRVRGRAHDPCRREGRKGMNHDEALSLTFSVGLLRDNP